MAVTLVGEWPPHGEFWVGRTEPGDEDHPAWELTFAQENGGVMVASDTGCVGRITLYAICSYVVASGNLQPTKETISTIAKETRGR